MAAAKRARTERKSPSPRREPQQARARETVEHIVATAADLLVDVGLPGFNTNRLAERAGITVPTVYRYFPDKIAILEELASRLIEAWQGWLDETLLADPKRDWREVWIGYIDAFVAGISAAPAGLAVRVALHSLPELREIEERDIRRLARLLSTALKQRDPSLDPRRVADVSGVLLTTAIAVLDQALSGSERKRARRIRELKEMQLAYLATLLED